HDGYASYETHGVTTGGHAARLEMWACAEEDPNRIAIAVTFPNRYESAVDVAELDAHEAALRTVLDIPAAASRDYPNRRRGGGAPPCPPPAPDRCRPAPSPPGYAWNRPSGSRPASWPPPTPLSKSWTTPS